MSKQEMLDFLNLYSITLKLENNSKWKDNTYHNDILGLLWKVTEYYEKIHFNVSCNNHYVDINIVATGDLTAGALDELNELLIDQNFDLVNHKFGVMKHLFGAEIKIKVTYKESKEIFLFLIDNLEKLIDK